MNNIFTVDILYCGSEYYIDLSPLMLIADRRDFRRQHSIHIDLCSIFLTLDNHGTLFTSRGGSGLVSTCFLHLTSTPYNKLTVEITRIMLHVFLKIYANDTDRCAYLQLITFVVPEQ